MAYAFTNDDDDMLTFKAGFDTKRKTKPLLCANIFITIKKAIIILVDRKKIDTMIPCVYALMTNKSMFAYTLNTKFIMSDFEKAIRNIYSNIWIRALRLSFSL